ncbi:hypothetical protein CBS147355_1270 [Penicillium roqueforti]|nr:hypothetical protein CBS147355_1270 [Penicillium roqueforti]
MPQPGLPLVHMHPGTDSQPERSQFKLTGNGANSSYHMLSGSMGDGSDHYDKTNFWLTALITALYVSL